MKRNGSLPDAIDFPANPFVGLSDFIMVVLLLVVLGFVYQSVSSNRFLERVAVENAQSRWFNDLIGKSVPSNNASEKERQPLKAAYQANPKQFDKIWVDGDLQRFWFDGTLLYKEVSESTTAGTSTKPSQSTSLTPEGRRWLIEPSGRGCWDARVMPSSGMKTDRIRQTNRRLEIVVVYSAPRAAQYEKQTVSRP